MVIAFRVPNQVALVVDRIIGFFCVMALLDEDPSFPRAMFSGLLLVDVSVISYSFYKTV